MATERIEHEEWMDTLTPEEEVSAARARADAEAGRAYVIGPEDLEDFVNLGPEIQRRMTREDIDAWLKVRAAKYT